MLAAAEAIANAKSRELEMSKAGAKERDAELERLKAENSELRRRKVVGKSA